jgi:putative ABC transport system permease protein
LTWKNVTGRAFRSVAVFLCAALVAGLALTATLVIRGAENSLRASLQQLGADLVIIPWGTMSQGIDGARLMSSASTRWMPRAYMEKVAALPEVDKVSPQLFLAALPDLPACGEPSVNLVAFDPATDFTVTPWLPPGREDLTLGPDQALAGNCLAGQVGKTVSVFGYPLELVATLAPTGTDTDWGMFVTFETAERLRQAFAADRRRPIQFAPDSISVMMVRVALHGDAHQVTLDILDKVPRLLPLESPNLFQVQRDQVAALLRAVVGMLATIWGLAMLFVGLVFTLAANERQRELAVLRALGADRGFVMTSLLAEGALLAVGGGLLGIGLVGAVLLAFGGRLGALELPFFVPPLGVYLGLGLGAVALAALTVMLAAALPTWRAAQQEVSLAMRE